MVENTIMMVTKGDWVCDGMWYDRVERTKSWYTLGNDVVTVRMKNVLHADLIMIPISSDNPLPWLHPTVQNHVVPLHPEMLRSSNHDFMMDEIGRREMLSYDKEVVDSDNEGHSKEEEDEGEEEEDKSTDEE